jgi:hypothetical protein
MSRKAERSFSLRWAMSEVMRAKRNVANVKVRQWHPHTLEAWKEALGALDKLEYRLTLELVKLYTEDDEMYTRPSVCGGE